MRHIGSAQAPAARFPGQGFAQATEDALELATQLARRNIGPEALRAYEEARLHRVARIADFEWVSQRSQMNPACSALLPSGGCRPQPASDRAACIPNMSKDMF